MQIDEVTPPTLPVLERGLRALAVDLSDPYTLPPDSLHEALFGAEPRCRGVVAAEGAEPRGIALFSPVMSTMLGAPGIYVSDLWVAAEARGARLGQRLLAKAVRLSDARFVRLAVYAENTGATAFYDRLGFQPRTGETIMHLSGHPLDQLVRME